MSWWQFIQRSLRYYRRTHLAVILATAVGSAVLVGALAVGDSMKFTLRRSMENRLGKTTLTLLVPHGFVTESLARRLSKAEQVPVAPVVYSLGIVSDGSGRERVNQVHIYGVNEQFYQLNADLPAAADRNPFDGLSQRQIVLNQSLADRLEVQAGDQIILRLEKPESLSRDMVLVSDAGRSIASRLTVGSIADADRFGSFSLEANQSVPYNVFVPLAWLQQQMQREGLVNVLLVGGEPDVQAVDRFTETLQVHWQLEDTGLKILTLKEGQVYEFQSRRVFLEEAVSNVLLAAAENTAGVLTYFVNSLRLGNRATPYSMVAAVNSAAFGLPSMSDDDMVITQWLAEDLNAQPGDTITLSYYVPDAQTKLLEMSKAFTVKAIIPMDHPAVDPHLMPDFPGMSDVDNCRDWDTGAPIDLESIRDKDEAYWDQYKGSPKAFISLSAGQALWANRYGNLTAVWIQGDEQVIQDTMRSFLNELDPAALGLFFTPVRALSLDALEQGTDFGPLFLGLSMFLIVGAMILTGLLFAFAIESRTDQTGLLLALGIRSRSIGLFYLAEGAVLAIVGSFIGVGLGLIYARGLMTGLNHLWQGAIAGVDIAFYASSGACLQGAVGGVVAALVAMSAIMRSQFRHQARALLNGETRLSLHLAKRRRDIISLTLAVLSVLGAVFMVVSIPETANSTSLMGFFFGAGALVFVFGISLSDAVLGALASRWRRSALTFAHLAVRNTSRRRGRSLAVISLLAFGVFVVVAVVANRRDPLSEQMDRASGTGGFAWVGQLSAGLLQDINTEAGQTALGLDPDLMQEVSVVPMRVRDGDEASCLNLNRAQRPRLLGVDPDRLARLHAFTFDGVLDGIGNQTGGWSALSRDLGPNDVPVIADSATVKWALGKKLGAAIDYRDERGRSFHARIVATLAGSILQGNLIMAESRFVTRYPSEEGYRFLLIDAPDNGRQEIANHMEDRLQDLGLTLTDTRARLAAFMEVENTYLSMFMALGALGLLLGSVGMALVVLRNLLDRRREFAMLLAVGLNRALIQRLAFYEHWGLLLAGVFWGTVAAMVAVWPAVRLPSVKVPYAVLVILIISIAACGALWVWLAACSALQGRLLDALRSE